MFIYTSFLIDWQCVCQSAYGGDFFGLNGKYQAGRYADIVGIGNHQLNNE